MTLQFIPDVLPESRSDETPLGVRGGQHRSRGHIRGGASPRGMLADVQAGIGMVQTALLALDESCALLEKLGVLVEEAVRQAAGEPVRHSSGGPATPGTGIAAVVDSTSGAREIGLRSVHRSERREVGDQQAAVADLVAQLDLICRGAVFEGVVVLDGSLAGHRVQMGAAGAAVDLDLPALDAEILGLHRPWGRAATGLDPMGASIVSSRGIVPSGVFRLVRGAILNASDEVVGVCEGSVLGFHDGTSITFDHPVANPGRPGTVCLDGVISVRTPEAAERALETVIAAYATVSERRDRALRTLRELTDVAIALGVALASAQDESEIIADRETAGDVLQLVRRELDRTPELAGHAAPREAVIRRLLA